MKMQMLFSDIDLTKTKLIRHNMSSVDVADNYARGAAYFEAYQARQRPGAFGNCEYILSFLGTEGMNGVYVGCYQITGCVPYDESLVPDDFAQTADNSDDAFYKMIKLPIHSDLENRLIIDWGKSARSWCQNGTTEKEVLCILPPVSEIAFTSFDKVILSYKNLKTIIDNPKEHENMLIKQ